MVDGWKDTLKFMAVLVASGVVTAVAVEWVTRRLEERAILAARAELQQTLTLLAQAQQPQQATPPQEAPSQSTTNFI